MILRSVCAVRSASSLTAQIGILPDLIVPANAITQRSFTTTARCNSRIGSAPISIPDDVHLQVLDPTRMSAVAPGRDPPNKSIEIAGPLGKLSIPLPPYMKLDNDIQARKATLSVQDREIRKQREMWGTTRAYLLNHVLGVSEGHTAILRLVGVGYRATIESTAVTQRPEYPGQQFVSLKVGYTHPIEMGVPLDMKASTPQPTRILLEGADKEVVNQFAAKIRKWRVPEPYKGKGIFVNGETIKLKAKKIK